MSAEPMKSKFVRRTSSVGLWHQLSLNLLHGILSNFGCCFPWAIPPDVFWIFEKKNAFSNCQGFFVVSLTWTPVGAKTSKRYPSLKLLLNPFKLLLNFLLSGPHKSTVLDFRTFWDYDFSHFFPFSLTWDPMGAKTSKRYSSYKLQPKVWNFSWIFLPMVLTKVCLGFLKFWVSDF